MRKHYERQEADGAARVVGPDHRSRPCATQLCCFIVASIQQLIYHVQVDMVEKSFLAKSLPSEAIVSRCIGSAFALFVG